MSEFSYWRRTPTHQRGRPIQRWTVVQNRHRTRESASPVSRGVDRLRNAYGDSR